MIGTILSIVPISRKKARATKKKKTEDSICPVMIGTTLRIVPISRKKRAQGKNGQCVSCEDGNNT